MKDSVQLTYSVKTLGCKANLYDSQLIEAELQKRGLTPAENDEAADLCIVNSCTVTDEADIQSRKLATKASKQGQGRTKVLLTGCGAEVNPDLYAKTKGVDFVAGNQDKNLLVERVLEQLKNVKTTDKATLLGQVTPYSEILSKHPMDREWAAPESLFMLPPVAHEGDTSRTRAFLKIQEGCNAFCTYCIIPYGRGPGRSQKIEPIIDQVKQLIDRGAREVVLTGTNIGDYGVDFSETKQPILEDLVEAILQKTSLERLRLGSLDPVEITPRLLKLMQNNPRFLPHFHVSLQSPHTRVLKAMKRKYNAEDVSQCLHAISNIKTEAPVFIGMDVITGFPGETLEEFEWSVQQLESLPWDRLHVFPYSERTGTPATKIMQKVQPAERKRRAQILRNLSLKRLQETHHRVLQKSPILDGVLLESETRGPDPQKVWLGGYSPNYQRVLLGFSNQTEAQKHVNQIVRVQLESLYTDTNQGDVAFIASIYRNH